MSAECSAQDCKKDATRKGMCQNHYRQEIRRDRGLKKPGPQRQPDAKHSKHRDRCSSGHVYQEGTFKLSSIGRRICLICLEGNKRTHCPAGHPYDEDNIFYVNGTPQCKICRSERMKERRPAKGIGAGGVNKAKTHCPKGHEYIAENTYVTMDGRRTCRTCANANSQVQRIKSHGISVEYFDQLLISQNYQCKICKDELTERSGQCIDHDHNCCPGDFSCGQCVRGILCKKCNTMIGFAEDDSTILRRGADYLDSFK